MITEELLHNQDPYTFPNFIFTLVQFCNFHLSLSCKMILCGHVSGHFAENPIQEGFCHISHEDCILFSWGMCSPAVVTITLLNYHSLVEFVQIHKYNLWIITNKNIFCVTNNLRAADISCHLSNDIVGGKRSTYKSFPKSPKGWNISSNYSSSKPIGFTSLSLNRFMTESKPH